MPNGTPTTIPTLRYADAPAAIDWLERAIGFKRGLVVEGEPGVIMHAQLSHGAGMIMLGSARDDDFGKLIQPPIATGMIGSQSVYLIVADVEAHHGNAVSHGAEIVTPLMSPEYGGRFYACRDPEGHLWGIGSYDPWAEVSESNQG